MKESQAEIKVPAGRLTRTGGKYFPLVGATPQHNKEQNMGNRDHRGREKKKPKKNVNEKGIPKSPWTPSRPSAPAAPSVPAVPRPVTPTPTQNP
jgi:hypothetical protein